MSIFGYLVLILFSIFFLCLPQGQGRRLVGGLCLAFWTAIVLNWISERNSPSNPPLSAGSTSLTAPAPAQQDVTETSLTNDKTGQMLFVGQTLWNGDSLYGKIIETRPSHTFENGVTEAGVLVDFSGRADMEGSPPPPLWMPARSAATMARSGR